MSWQHHKGRVGTQPDMAKQKLRNRVFFFFFFFGPQRTRRFKQCSNYAKYRSGASCAITCALSANKAMSHAANYKRVCSSATIWALLATLHKSGWENSSRFRFSQAKKKNVGPSFPYNLRRILIVWKKLSTWSNCAYILRNYLINSPARKNVFFSHLNQTKRNWPD